MKTKASLIIMSALSDAQEEIGNASYSGQNTMLDKTNFAKFLILKYPNTNTKIDADAEFSDFRIKFPD
jgi:hypothetical protein